MLRGPLAGWLAGMTVRSPPTLSASLTRLGFFAVSLRRKPRRFCILTIAESTLTSARLKSPGWPHGGEIGPRSATLGGHRSAAAASLVALERRRLYSRTQRAALSKRVGLWSGEQLHGLLRAREF